MHIYAHCPSILFYGPPKNIKDVMKYLYQLLVNHGSNNSSNQDNTNQTM